MCLERSAMRNLIAACVFSLAMIVSGGANLSGQTLDENQQEFSRAKVQAPYDSFVCYNTTFEACATSVQGGAIKILHDRTYSRQRPSRGVSLLSTKYIIEDPDAKKIVTTTDTKYSCQLSEIPYAQKLKPSILATAVFVSPVLLRQIDETHI